MFRSELSIKQPVQKQKQTKNFILVKKFFVTNFAVVCSQNFRRAELVH